VLVPPTHNVEAPAVNDGVPTFGVTVTTKSAVVGPPQLPVAVALTVKFPVTLLTAPVVGLMVAPPLTMLYDMLEAPVAVAEYVLVPPTHNVDAPAVKLGVPRVLVTVTTKSAVVGPPQEPVAVALTVKFPVTLLTAPVVELMVAPPLTMLYDIFEAPDAVAV
jgi:hypothetical protein